MSEQHFKLAWVRLLKDAMRGRKLRNRDVASWVGLTETAFGRRLNGKANFTLFEAARLSQWFGLPTTPRALAMPEFTFRPSPRGDSGFCTEAYLGGLEAVFAKYDAVGAGAPPPGTRMRVTASDLPIFWFFGEPALAALKLYAFETGNGAYAREPADVSRACETQSALIERAADVAERYKAVDSRELWGHDPLSSFLDYLFNLARGRLISRGDTKLAIEALYRLAGMICEASIENQKSTGGSFELYLNSSHRTNTIIGVSGVAGNSLYLTFDNPHFLASDQPAADAYFEKHFRSAAQRAARVTGHGTFTARILRDELIRDIECAERRLTLEFESHSLAFGGR